MAAAARCWPWRCGRSRIVTVGRVYRRVAARLAAGPAAPRRRRVPAADRRLRGRRRGRASTAAGPPRWPRPAPGRHGWHHLAALSAARTFAGRWPRPRSRPGWPWPPGCGRGGTTPIIGRDRRPDGLRPGHLRRPPVETPGPRRRRPHRRARLRPAADPGRDASRSAGPSAPSACQWKPVFAVPAAACARHMVIIGATGCGKTNLMMRLWAGLVHRRPGRLLCREGGPAAADRAGLQGRPGRPPQGRPDPPPALRRRRPPRRHLARRGPRVHLGPARPPTWPCCCTR